MVVKISTVMKSALTRPMLSASNRPITSSVREAEEISFSSGRDRNRPIGSEVWGFSKPLKIKNLRGVVVRESANGAGDQGTIHGRVIPLLYFKNGSNDFVWRVLRRMHRCQDKLYNSYKHVILNPDHS